MIPQTMTAVEISEPGGPEVLTTTTRSVPVPAEGEILVHVGAAGINGPDVLQRKGCMIRHPALRTSPAWRSRAASSP